MLETDGDRHRALRRLLQDEFTPKVLAGYETFLRGLARVDRRRRARQAGRSTS